MTYKIHLLRNKNPDQFGAIPACATNPHLPKAKRNSRATYQSIPASAIVPIRAFAAAPAADRCAHCCDAALIIRQRQRKTAGQSPITTPFEGL